MTFKPGDLVRNVNADSAYYASIKDKTGVYLAAWPEPYYSSMRRPCDVSYPGVVDLYGRENIAQSEDDLELATDVL